MSVLIVIVNYRTPALVVECLRSLQAELQPNDHASVVVVDNASGDGSPAHIGAAIVAEGWSPWVRLVESQLNGGFSFGNNVAIRPALEGASPPDYFWLLNPDTQVRPGALSGLIEFLRAHPDVGIAGSAIEEEDSQPWPYAFRFPSLLSELDRGLRLGFVTRLLGRWTILRRMNGHPEQVDWVAGASMMVRREVFDAIGLMDEQYFLYFEETDFCLQALRAGWACWYVPCSVVMHLSGRSTGLSHKHAKPKRMPKYWFDSRRRYFIKNRSRAYAVATDLVFILSFAIWRIRRAIQRREDSDAPYLLHDFVRHSALLTADIHGNPAVPARPET